MLIEDLVYSNCETTNHIAGNQSLNMSRMQNGVQINRNPPPLTKEASEEIDAKFMNINKESWQNMCAGRKEPEEFIEDMNTTLAKYFSSIEEFQHKTNKFFNHSSKKEDTLEEMRKEKNLLNKKAKLKNASDED